MEHTTAVPKLNLLPACIVAAGMIISAIIIAGPKMPVLFPPVSVSSARLQIASQLQSHVAGRPTVNKQGKPLRFDRVNVEFVEYDSEKNRYHIRYSLHWEGGRLPQTEWNKGIGATLGTGCFLTSTNSKTFTGDCRIATEGGYTRFGTPEKVGADESVTVPISIR